MRCIFDSVLHRRNCIVEEMLFKFQEKGISCKSHNAVRKDMLCTPMLDCSKWDKRLWDKYNLRTAAKTDIFGSDFVMQICSGTLFSGNGLWLASNASGLANQPFDFIVSLLCAMHKDVRWTPEFASHSLFGHVTSKGSCHDRLLKWNDRYSYFHFYGIQSAKIFDALQAPQIITQSAKTYDVCKVLNCSKDTKYS